MPDNTKEFADNTEEDKEPMRRLVSSIAANQLKALGYEHTLVKFQEWFRGNPLEGFQFSQEAPDEFIEKFKKEGLLETYLGELKRIPDKEQARKLVSAALFGIPFSQDKNGTMIAQYSIEEPNNRTRQTEFDPNRDSKDKIIAVPNTEGTKLLGGRVVNTGFLSPSKVPLDAIRQLSWANREFNGTYQMDASVKMTIKPAGSTFSVQIYKAG